jgi:hypothetical protein
VHQYPALVQAIVTAFIKDLVKARAVTDPNSTPKTESN